MKRRVIEARAREVMKWSMPTCYFNATTPRFAAHIPASVGLAYFRYSSYRYVGDNDTLVDMIEESIRAGQKSLPRRAKDWHKRNCVRRRRY